MKYDVDRANEALTDRLHDETFVPKAAYCDRCDKRFEYMGRELQGICVDCLEEMDAEE